MSKIIFILGVSGSGKGTVIQHLLEKFPERYTFVRSYTTRPQREGESAIAKHNFVDNKTFSDMINKKEFLEYEKVHDAYRYGTKLSEVEYALAQGKYVLKEVDIQGLVSIKANGAMEGKYASVFFDIPNETIIERITKRAPISQQEIELRIASTEKERILGHQLCNYIIDANKTIPEVFADVEKTFNNF